MTVIRTLAYTTLFVAGLALPAVAQSGDTRAHVDSAHSNTVVYPPNFEASGEEGAVMVNVGVESSGQITHAKITGSSGHHDLDIAALETAVSWHYVPATHDGETHPDEITLRIVYNRPDAPAAASAH
jgi:TonB family protein